MLAYLSILTAIVAGMAGAPFAWTAVCAAGLVFAALAGRGRMAARDFRLAAMHTAGSLVLAGLISMGAFWSGLAMAAILQL